MPIGAIQIARAAELATLAVHASIDTLFAAIINLILVDLTSAREVAGSMRLPRFNVRLEHFGESLGLLARAGERARLILREDGALAIKELVLLDRLELQR